MIEGSKIDIIESGTVDSVLPKKEMLKTFIIMSIIMVSLGLMTQGIIYGISLEEGFSVVLPYTITWLITIGVIFLVTGLDYWYMTAYVKRFKYELSEKFIIINSGVFTREKSTIPFSRIQNIVVNQGIIDRIYGIYEVKIETAGTSIGPGSGQNKSEGVIPGIKNPSKLEKIINNLVHDYTQKPYTTDLKGKIFDQPEIAFDEFAAYFLSKMTEGSELKTKIKELREKNNISQGDLAEKIGVSRQTINYIENGKIIPSLKIADQIAKLFKVPIEKIFDFSDEEK